MLPGITLTNESCIKKIYGTNAFHFVTKPQLRDLPLSLTINLCKYMHCKIRFKYKLASIILAYNSLGAADSSLSIMLVERYLNQFSGEFQETLFASLLIFASIAICVKRTKKKRPNPQESVMIGTIIRQKKKFDIPNKPVDTKIDSKREQSLQKIPREEQNKKPLPPPNAPDVKPNVEKTLLIEFERENNQQNKSYIGKNEKESTGDSQKLEINETQASSLELSVQSDKTQQDVSEQINHSKIKSAESSKIESFGKSEGYQKDGLKIGKEITETDSHATSKQEESSNKYTSLA
uniref:Transporter n=1 Tax=Elaeophora elaphi TaxID=1147741 RepID=A0A0R3RJ77_9BILA